MAASTPSEEKSRYEIKTLLICRSNVGEINELQKSVYRVEASITGIKNIPNLMESDEQLLQSGEQFLGCYVSGKLGGFLSFEQISEKCYQICRLVVSPENFGKGIGFMLVKRAIFLCSPGTILVTTGKGNIPARKLYEKAGFEYKGELKVQENVVLWKFFLN